MEVLIIMGIVSGIVALIVKAVKGHNRQIEESWAAAAQRLGMQFSSGEFMKTKSIHGRLYDNRVEVDTFKRSTGKSSTTYTRYRIYYPETLGLGLQLKQQGFMAGVAALFGSQDIELGDPEFDAQVVVKSTSPPRAVEFLTRSRRRRVLQLIQEYPACEITDHVIEWSKRGNEKEAEQIVSTVRGLARAATSFFADPERQPAQSVPVSIIESSAPETESMPVSPMPVAAPPAPEPEPEPIEQDPEPPRSVVESPATAATAGPEVATVCEELFASNLSSSETRRLFDERYKDHVVRWSGKLRQVSSYQIDMVFKGAPGTKVVLEVEEAVVGSFGRKVQAILQLPTDALEELRTRTGEWMTFEGRLLSCDALMRNFYVIDGKLA